MSEIFHSQVSALLIGINAFAPFVEKINSDFNMRRFKDWPTLILATTLQATAVSLFKLIPPAENTAELLDRRTLATLVRNLVDTHDVIEMVVNSEVGEELSLNRSILGLYISSRIAHIQNAISSAEAQKFFPLTKTTYWDRIQKSPLYNNATMSKLRNGETIFYKTRKERLSTACGRHAAFVEGILADLSTYVHSIPPALWMGKSTDIYADTSKNREMVAIWIRLANFYYARSLRIIMKSTDYVISNELRVFLDHHQEVFS